MSTLRRVPEGYIIGRLWRTGASRSTPAAGAPTRQLPATRRNVLLAPTADAARSFARLSRQLSDLYGQFNYQRTTVSLAPNTSTQILPADPLRIYQRVWVSGTALYQPTSVQIDTQDIQAGTPAIDLGGHPIQVGMMFKDHAIEICQPVYLYSSKAGTITIYVHTIRAQQ